MNGRASGGGHSGGYRGGANHLPMSRDSPPARPPPPPSPFDSRNHKEIVDFFQQNFDVIFDQTQSTAHSKSAGASRKAVYYQPPVAVSAADMSGSY